MKCHDRATRCFSTASSDYHGRRCWRINCRGKCGARAGQDAAEKREVPRHSEGRTALRELQAVPTTISLQSRGWNYFPARLVHGLYEGLVARFTQIEGYTCLSLTRAVGAVKCQLALV